MLAKQHDTKHRQQAAAIFLLYLLLESTSILRNVIIAISIEAKTMDPKAEVNIHL